MVLLAQAAVSLLMYRNVALSGADGGGSTITLSMPISRIQCSVGSLCFTRAQTCRFLME